MVKTRAAKVRPRTFPILPGCFGSGECLDLQIASNIFTQRLENTLRKIIVSMRVTLDGFIAGPQGEMDWMEEFFDEALATYEAELQKTVDTTLFGRLTYQGFASYWPQVALDCRGKGGPDPRGSTRDASG